MAAECCWSKGTLRLRVASTGMESLLVTGSITFTGGGGKNVTGAMMAGASASADLVGGDAAIVYCSRAISDQTDSLPLITLRWVELFS